MLTIIIGIVLAVIFVFVFMPRSKSVDVALAKFFMGILMVILAILIVAFSPISGYNEWGLIEETELISLSNDVASGETGMVYVSLSADNVYTYRYEINSEFGTETSREYKTTALHNKDVEEIEAPDCEVPVIRVYQRDAKRTIWTFGWYIETKYVFYVPEGTISKEIKLN